jgi:hypothetical protein
MNTKQNPGQSCASYSQTDPKDPAIPRQICPSYTKFSESSYMGCLRNNGYVCTQKRTRVDFSCRAGQIDNILIDREKE